jgi:hypothetical protein
MGLYKTELIRRLGPWRTAEQVELATAACRLVESPAAPQRREQPPTG